MKDSVTISIVTISYNQAMYLEECILSVLNQKLNNVEYIVVDAGSSDGSLDILKRYEDQIDIVLVENDSGPADGLNKGFSLSHGSILGYINADDRLSANALQYVTRYFSSHPSIDVITGSISIIDTNGKKRFRSRSSDTFGFQEYCAGICMIGQQATFFRRSAFINAGMFNIDNRIAWDGELIVDMALAGSSIKRISRVLGEFRVHSDSLSTSQISVSARKKYLADLELFYARMTEKTSQAGYIPYSRYKIFYMRFLYKINVKRHISYLISR